MTNRIAITLLLVGICQSAFAETNTYEFRPDGDFSVVFPAVPNQGEYETFEGTHCTTTYAILVLWDGRAGLRAESIVCQGYDEQTISKESTFQLMKEHARASLGFLG